MVVPRFLVFGVLNKSGRGTKSKRLFKSSAKGKKSTKI